MGKSFSNLVIFSSNVNDRYKVYSSHDFKTYLFHKIDVYSVIVADEIDIVQEH